MLNFLRYRRIGTDFGLNFIANIIYIVTLQLVVYPAIAEKCNAESYGVFLMIMGLVTTSGGTFGNSLNNLRLILNEKYQKENLFGDFNILLLVSLCFNVGLLIVCGTYFRQSFLQTFCFGLLLFLTVIRNYISVEFRLNINYKKILLLNVFLSLGLFVGVVWFKYLNSKFEHWNYIFLLSEFFAMAFLIKNTILLKEPLVRTILFFKTFHKYGNLVYMSFITCLLLYFDRNLLFPLLGGAAVSTYFAATVVGKASSLVAGPMSSVLLSYYAQVDFEMTQKKFWQINKAICAASVVTYIGTVLVVDWVVAFLYPSLYSEAKKIFYLANIVPVLDVVANMARPAILRYVSLDKLSIFQTLFLLATIGVSYFAITWYGLIGFCYGAILLSVIRVAVMWTLGHLVLAGK